MILKFPIVKPKLAIPFRTRGILGEENPRRLLQAGSFPRFPLEGWGICLVFALRKFRNGLFAMK